MNLLSFQAVINLIFPERKKASWFPPPNIWNQCGLHVGQWTEESEKWFQEHISKIHTGNFQPLSSGQWRTHIRYTRMAVKVTRQMKRGAANFISAHQHFLNCHITATGSDSDVSM